MNVQALKTGLLDSTAQVIVFDSNGKLLSSCDTLFHIPDDIAGSLYSSLPILESLQYSFTELKQGEELKIPCMWFDNFGVAAYYDFTFIKKETAIVWLIQDFDEFYKNQIVLQQERNESILNSELLKLHRQTQEELRKAEKEYKHLFNNTLDLIQSIDVNGKFIFVNPAWLKALKYTKSEIAKMTFLDIIHPDDVFHCTQLFQELNNSKKLMDIEVKFLDKNGSIIYVHGNINSVIEKGKFVASQGIFKNVTLKKLAENKLKENEAMYRLLVESASDVIFKTDISGKIIYMNDVGLKASGYQETKIKSMDFTEWVHPDYKLKIRNVYYDQFANKKNSTYQEFPIILNDKKQVWVGQHANLLFETVNGKEQIAGFLLITRDISKQKELENALNNANKLLDEKVIEKTSALKQTNEELIHVNKELDSFLYSSSHSLRGPIARISGLSNLMKLKGETHNLFNYLDYIDKEVSSMDRLTDQLTSYHGIYSYNLSNSSPEKIDIERLLNSLLNAKHNDALTNCCYSLDVAGNVQLFSNTELITIALDNILDNSFQFKNEKAGEEHHVSATVKIHQNLIVIKIRDNGEGISKELQNNVFNMFFKGSPAQGGNGLGLYLAKKAIEKLHGKIEVISKKGQFSEFIILLPKTF